MNHDELCLADAGIHEITTRVTRCFLGKAYYVGYFNNTAVGTSALFVRDELGPLFCTRQAVTQYIEPKRTKGRSWAFVEVPIVVIEACGEYRLVLSGNQKEVDPLDAFSPLFPKSFAFGELAKAFMSHSECSKNVYTFWTPFELEPADLPFQRYFLNSRTRSWEPQWWSVNLHGALKVTANISLWLQESSKLV
jgi:hypothetical protein